MTPSSQPEDPDPLSAYVRGDPDAVRAARPPEPSEAAWDEARLRIRSRLAGSCEPVPSRRRVAMWGARGAALTAAAAAVAWVAFGGSVSRPPQAPDVAQVKPPPPEAPAPHDPLAEFAVLPMAAPDEVVLHRVPGDGWLPVGADPLPGALALATAAEVELDDPETAWPNVTTSPADAPMIFAAKPR